MTPLTSHETIIPILVIICPVQILYIAKTCEVLRWDWIRLGSKYWRKYETNVAPDKQTNTLISPKQFSHTSNNYIYNSVQQFAQASSLLKIIMHSQTGLYISRMKDVFQARKRNKYNWNPSLWLDTGFLGSSFYCCSYTIVGENTVVNLYTNWLFNKHKRVDLHTVTKFVTYITKENNGYLITLQFLHHSANCHTHLHNYKT